MTTDQHPAATLTAGTSSTAMLEFNRVSSHYNHDLPLFTDLTFMVQPGQFIALAGRSGSGKSTVLRIASGLRRPDSGTVNAFGQDLYSLDDDARAALRSVHYGIARQDGGLIQGLTALENVLLPFLHRPVRRSERDAAMAALDTVGLAGRSRHTAGHLSGGEIQRVAIARALFTRPQLLIVDEPTASLDRSNAEGVIALLNDIVANDRGILVATHDPHVLAIAQRQIQIG